MTQPKSIIDHLLSMQASAKINVLINFSAQFFFRLLLLLFTCCNSLLANDKNLNSSAFSSGYEQWFAGPLFTPNATTVERGHPAIEAVIILEDTYGKYDSSGHLHHTSNLISIIPYLDFQVGLSKRIGLEIIGLATKNFSKGATSTHLKDTIFRVGYQISTDVQDSWIPDLRILFQETFPTGNYQKLSLQKNGADRTGQGSYQSGFHLAAQKLFAAKSKHPFRLRGDFGYFFQSSVRVEGLNFYGGDIETEGTVYPKSFLTLFLFGEYSLTKPWALGCELNFLRGCQGKFSRKRGMQIEVPAYTQLMIFPEIQRTISSRSAIIFGGTYTLAGKNVRAFRNILFAFLHIF